MAGIAIVLDLLRKNPAQSLHSSCLFSATLAASAAAASVAAATPFPSRSIFGFGAKSIAHCDAGPAAISEDCIENYISTIRTASANIFQNEVLKYSTKEYNIELKPLFSAFQLKSFALTSLRALLLFYLPLLEPRSNIDEDDDDDFLQDIAVEDTVNLVVPFKKSIRQIIRETSVVTTRRILERIAVYYASQRMAWKLLKDVPKSAVRKAQRGMPTSVYFFSVCRTTFRGHFLGVAASWLVQVVIDLYRFFSSNSAEVEREELYKAEQARLLGKKVVGVTVRCGASLVFASVGAAVGSTCLHPSAGQWIGCAVGDLAGPIIVSFCLERTARLDP